MKVYVVTVECGNNYDSYEYTFGIYDELAVAEYECIEAMERYVLDDEHDTTTEFCIDEWEMNKEMTCPGIRKWWRAEGGKYGHFINVKDWEMGVTKGYTPNMED